MQTRDAVLQAEKEIDEAFASSTLVQLPYSQATWTLLSMNEDAYLKAIHTLTDERHLRVFADTRLNALTYPLRVCFERSHPGALRWEYISSDYEHAWKWLEAAEDYTQFSTIFPLWHRQRIDIAVDGNKLIITDRHDLNKTYEAYGRLFRNEAPDEPPTIQAGDAVVQALLENSTVRADSFQVNFNPPLVARLVAYMTPYIASRHTLPADWQFATFSLDQYRKILLTLQALMFGWHTVRTIAADNGMPGLGYASSVWVVGKDALIARLARYTGVDRATVTRIVELITFGSSEIRTPDVALQPLIELKSGLYAVDPFILLNSNIERNLCVLLNQIPSERDAYSRLSNQKEAATRAEIIGFLAAYGFEFRSGNVQGTDLDLAIIDHANKCCISLELKWFIEPAEIREVEQRTAELAYGVTQAKKIQALFDARDSHLTENVLRVTPDYKMLCAVGSVNWIGFGDVQDTQVPIIKVGHLLRSIQETR